jgi:hypothetical protein
VLNSVRDLRADRPADKLLGFSQCFRPHFRCCPAYGVNTCIDSEPTSTQNTRKYKHRKNRSRGRELSIASELRRFGVREEKYHGFIKFRQVVPNSLRSMRPLGFVCASTIVAAAPGMDSFSSVLPPYLKGMKSNSPVSEQVFDAFHSKEPLTKSTAEVPMFFPAAPPAHLSERVPHDRREQNPPGDLGKAGTVELHNTTNGYADGIRAPGGTTRKDTREISTWSTTKGRP